MGGHLIEMDVWMGSGVEKIFHEWIMIIYKIIIDEMLFYEWWSLFEMCNCWKNNVDEVVLAYNSMNNEKGFYKWDLPDWYNTLDKLNQ